MTAGVLPPGVSLPAKLDLEIAYGICGGGVEGGSSLREHVQPGRQYVCPTTVLVFASVGVDGGKNRAVKGSAYGNSTDIGKGDGFESMSRVQTSASNAS